MNKEVSGCTEIKVPRGELGNFVGRFGLTAQIKVGGENSLPYFTIAHGETLVAVGIPFEDAPTVIRIPLLAVPRPKQRSFQGF